MNEVVEQVNATHVQLNARVVLLIRRNGGGYDVDQVVDTTQTFSLDDLGWRISARDEWPLHTDDT